MSIDGWYKKVAGRWKPLGLGGEKIIPTRYYVTTHDDMRDDGYFFDTAEEALAFYEETAAKGVIEYTIGGHKRTEPCRVKLYNHRELIKIAYPTEPEEEFQPEDGAPPDEEEEFRTGRRRTAEGETM